MNSIVTFFIKKFIFVISVVVGTTLLVFFLIKIAPGDPYISWSEELKQAWGVYEPLHVQYLQWLGDVIVLDLGHSISQLGEPVLRLVFTRYLQTLIIVVGGLLVGLLIAVPFGFLSVYRHDSKLVQVTQRLIELLSATPIFIIGYLVFLLFLSYNKNLALRENFGIYENLFFYSIVFFVLGLGNGTAIEFIKHIRHEINTIKSRMFMKAVRARSANYSKHLIRNSIIPVLTIISNRFIFLLSGAVIIEKLFTIRGIGLLSIEAAKHRDYPLILGIAVFTVFIVLIVKISIGVISGQINPRVKVYG